MGNPIRKYEHGKTYFITNRLAEGLPFVPVTYINLVLKGILSETIHRFGDDIATCGFGAMPNHYHGMATIIGNPEVFADYLNFLDGEMAKAVCCWLGKSHVKIWSQRCHVALLGDATAAREKLAYLYANPVAAGFCPTAKAWTGVTTFDILLGKPLGDYRYVPPSKLRRLPNAPFTKKLNRHLVSQIAKLPHPKRPLHIEPFAWKQSYPETRDLSDEQLRADLLGRIAELERYYQADFKRKNRSFSDPERLAEQNPHKPYRPDRSKKRGRRVYCICSCELLRKQLMEAYRRFCLECREAWFAWKQGEYHIPYPPGAFQPPRPPIAHCIPGVT